MTASLVWLAWATVALCLTLLSAVALWSSLRRRAPASQRPPITILKPLKGVDEELYENLVSLVCQDYPDFQLVFGAEDACDPALAVARRVAAEYPHVPMSVVSGAPTLGMNPKVNNLARLVQEAKHDFILISDSNVRVGPGYLNAMAAELSDPNVKLVCNLVAGEGEQTLGALLENTQLTCLISPSIAGAKVLFGHPCVVGKSMLLHRPTLESLGGFRAVANVLAEDYVLGQRFREAGHGVALSPYVVRVRHGRRSVREFIDRHVRWGQMRRQIAPRLYLMEPFGLAFPPLLLLMGSAAGLPSSDERTGLLVAGGLGILLRLLGDAWFLRTLRGRSVPLLDLAWSPVRESLQLGIWVLGGLSRSVMWRGNRLRVGPGSTLSPMPRRRLRWA